MRCLREQHLAYAVDLRCCFGDGATVIACDQHVYIRVDLRPGGDSVQRPRAELFVVMLRKNQNAHLNYLRFVSEFLDKLLGSFQQHTRFAWWWLRHFQDL